MAQTKAETGLPGRAENGGGAELAEDERLAGSHGDFPEIGGEAAFAEGFLD